MAQPDNQLPLGGRRIAVPESRMLDVLEGLLQRRGAEVLRCPLVTIVDAPDTAVIEAWLQNFVAAPPNYLILLTGEGLRRLHGFATGAGISDATLARALASTKLVSRGPKPARELRRFERVPGYFATTPTTDGIIETLSTLDIDGKSVAVQLYGDDPNQKLIDYLRTRNAVVSTVAPYRYAPHLSDESIRTLIVELDSGKLDAIVFTSKAQLERLFAMAADYGDLDSLKNGLARTTVAAVGPIVAEVLGEHGCEVQVMPEERFFMKPLVNALCDTFREQPS